MLGYVYLIISVLIIVLKIITCYYNIVNLYIDADVDVQKQEIFNITNNNNQNV